MQLFRNLTIVLALTVATVGCGGGGDDGDDDSSGGAGSGALTAPSSLKVAPVDGKPHLTWTDGSGEEHYMIERMDHAVSTEWVELSGANNLPVNTTQYHDASAASGKTYMYRVVGMKGQTRAASNEVTWTP